MDFIYKEPLENGAARAEREERGAEEAAEGKLKVSFTSLSHLRRSGTEIFRVHLVYNTV